MKIKLYQIDAFTDKVFKGNPAAVCPLINDWLPDEIMQNIANENNLAETAFYINKNNEYFIRWFTPEIEVDLCGHATLAAAHVLFNYENYPGNIVNFQSKSGVLFVSKNEGYLTLNFPTDEIEKVEMTDEIISGFNLKPSEAYRGKTDYMLVFDNENQIKDINVNMDKIAKIKARGIIITAKGIDADFVSRFFAPQSGIYEDPVTGSAHTTLVPYWSKILNKDTLTAKQLSKRTGILYCRNLNDRTEISGNAVTFLVGTIDIEV